MTQTPIDWTKPIETEDGTPLVLAQHGESYGDNTNPDSDGYYWVMIEGATETAYNTYCHTPNGTRANGKFGRIRNRAEPVAVEPVAATPQPAPKTLRDEFAMAALACSPDVLVPGSAAARAYRIADAMMAERERKA